MLRALEDQLMKGATHNLIARTRPDVALYVLNQKRAHLRGSGRAVRHHHHDQRRRDPARRRRLSSIDRGEQVHTLEAAKALAERAGAAVAPLEEEDDLEEPAAEEIDEAETLAEAGAEQGDVQGESEGGGRRRRRRAAARAAATAAKHKRNRIGLKATRKLPAK